MQWREINRMNYCWKPNKYFEQTTYWKVNIGTRIESSFVLKVIKIVKWKLFETTQIFRKKLKMLNTYIVYVVYNTKR